MSIFQNKLISASTVSVAFLCSLIANSTVAQLPYEYAQNSYQRGQHTEVAYEGWRVNEAGETVLTFGYFNHNWEEELDIPIGDNNFFFPGEIDRGQPTHFLPRRNRFTFDVVVGTGFDEDDELIWEVTSPNGKTRKAYGTLREDYKLDNVVIMSETGALGAGSSDEVTRANVPPMVELFGDTIRSVPVGEPLRLQTRISDDGVPVPSRRFGGGASSAPPEIMRQRLMMMPPPRPTVNKQNGLFLSWNVYRAPEGMDAAQDRVSFNPPQSKPWEDTRPSANSPWSWLWAPPKIPEDGVIDTEVIFGEPGTYLLWGRADDGGLYTDTYVTVNVTP